MPKTQIVKIERGRFARRFQLVRAYLSAAGALTADDPKKALRHVNDAIIELVDIKAELGGT